MAEKKSAVTAARFASGFTFKDYIAQIKVNKDRFEEYYKTCQLSAEDREFFQKVVKMSNGAARVLVLGEDWCPDVFRGMPAIARITEASGMEMRVFPRDQNLDIMNEFLNHGQFMHSRCIMARRELFECFAYPLIRFLCNFNALF